MKKNPKKLTLRTETVRALDAARLAAAAGGATLRCLTRLCAPGAIAYCDDYPIYED